MLKSPYTNTYTYIYIHNIYKKGKRFEKVDLDDPEKDLQTNETKGAGLSR